MGQDRHSFPQALLRGVPQHLYLKRGLQKKPRRATSAGFSLRALLSGIPEHLHLKRNLPTIVEARDEKHRTRLNKKTQLNKQEAERDSKNKNATKNKLTRLTKQAGTPLNKQDGTRLKQRNRKHYGVSVSTLMLYFPVLSMVFYGEYVADNRFGRA